MELKTIKKRIDLIDYLKGISIIAVVASHIHSLTPLPFVNYTIFCIPLFIFLAGITKQISLSKKIPAKRNQYYFIYKQGIRIAGLYAIAVMLHLIYRERYLEFALYWENLLSFTTSKQFYFVSLYLQLLLITPLLLRLIRQPKYKQIVIIILLVAIGLFTTKYTNITNSLGGGRKLFGGNFLIVYYLGLLFWRHYLTFLNWLKKPKNQFILFVLSVLSFVVFLILHLDKSFVANPPVLGTLFYTAIVFGGSSSIYYWLPQSVRKVLCYLGTYSLVIFIFHLLALDLLMRFFPPYFYCYQTICVLPLYFLIALFIPIVVYQIVLRGFTWLAV